jgi:RHS repeat-associated protein
MDTETFAGHPREPATALQYMRARWQNPTTGAFLSVDPMVPSISDPQSYNSYSYARNNPINLRDPTGMCPAALVGGTCPPPTWSDVVSIWLSKVIVSDYNFSEGSWAYFGMSNDSKYARVAGKYAGTAITFNQRTGRLASRGVGGDTGSTPGLSSSKKNGEVGAEVVAVREGEVIGSRWHVESDHSYGFGWFTRVADSKGVDYYGHLDPDSTLPAGTKVKAGSAIGRIAVPTNGFSSGPHVHLARKELANPGVWVNPGKTPAIVGGHISLGFGRPHPLFMPNIVPHYGVDWVP